MTNDKTRQEGPPAADPIRQETGGQEPPAADQASTKPVKKRGRPKKKKIIVVEGSKDQLTAASLLTEDQAAAEDQEPTNWQDMTPHEFMEYAKDNPEAARQDIQDYFSAGEGKEAADNLIAAVRAMQGITKAFTAEAQEATAETSVKIVARQLKELNFSISKIISAMCRVNELGALPEGTDEDTLDRFYDEWDALEPFVNAILATDPARKGMNAEQLLDTIPLWAVYHVDNMDGIDEKAQDAQEAADIKAVIEIIQRARAARDQATAEAARKAEAEKLPTVTYKNKPGIELTTDKLMTVFFGANAPAAPRGQIPGQMAFLPVKYEKTGAPEITLYYTYDFDDDLFKRLKLEKKIDDEDYFLLSFIANYWRGGSRTVSVAKLYKDMTGENPNNKQLTTLTNRLIKIAGTNIFINDKEVRQAWNIEDESKTYREILTPLAPIKVGAERFIARGKVVEAGIEILAEPDIMKLGYEMGQYTTIPKTLLHVKKKNGRMLTRSPRFYRVLHFLIRRISAIKSGNLPHKILYDTFYAEIGETTPRGRQLARDCMYTVLDHFKTCDKWITGYREETTPTTGQVGVRIFCADTTKNKVTTKK